MTLARSPLLWLWWLALLACLTGPAHAADGIALRIDALPPHLATVEPAALLAGQFDDQFAPFAEDRAPGFGPALWLRLSLPPEVDHVSGERVLELRTPFVNRFDMVLGTPGGVTQAGTAGNMVAPTGNVVRYQYPAFRIQLAAQSGPIYVRMDTRTTRNLTAHLWQPNAFGIQARERYLLQGVIFGVFFAFGLLYLVVGAQARNISYVVYALYVMGNAIVNGLAQGLIPLTPPLYNPIVGVGACLSVGLGAELLRIARPDRHYPQLMRAYRQICWTLAGVLALLAAAGLFNVVSPICQVIFLVQAASGCAIGLTLWYRGEPAGKSFFLGFLLMHVTLLGFVLQNLGMMPLLAWTPLALVVGGLGHVSMMSIGMAKRMRQLARESAGAQQALLESLRHSEQRLEQRVDERTAALRREMRRRQAAEAELRAANLRTEQALMAEREANQRQRDFFLMVSHDFRTPLSVLDATIGANARGQSTSQTRQARAQRALAELQTLLDTSLAAETFEGLEPDFSPVDIELAGLVEEVIRRTEDLDGAPRIVSRLERGCVVRGDPLWLRILLTNLLHNAAHHTPAGTRVHVHARRHDGSISLTIEDDGPGIETDALAALGRRFQRPAQTDSSGSGIGLYAVREIVERHEGQVSFDASPLGGLRVTIELPCAASTEVHAPRLRAV